MAVRRDAAMRAAIGGAQVFDERLPVHEDVDLCVRVERQGGSVAVAPELRMPHRRETSLRSFLARNFRMAQASRRIGAHRLAHRALVGALVAGVGLSAGAALAPALAPAALGAAGGYALLLLGCAVACAAERRDLRMVPLVPVLLAGLHMARALGYLWPASAWKERR
jgi:GT2 family glycosyltransferase